VEKFNCGCGAKFKVEVPVGVGEIDINCPLCTEHLGTLFIDGDIYSFEECKECC